jgi:hypothetical protein
MKQKKHGLFIDKNTENKISKNSICLVIQLSFSFFLLVTNQTK